MVSKYIWLSIHKYFVNEPRLFFLLKDGGSKYMVGGFIVGSV